MPFTLTQQPIHQIHCDTLLVGYFKTGLQPTSFTELDRTLSGQLTRLKQQKDLPGKLGHCRIIDTPSLKAKRIIMLGLGKDKASLTLDAYQKAILGACTAAQDMQCKHTATSLAEVKIKGTSLTDRAQQLATTWLQGGYHYQKPNSVNKVTLADISKSEKTAIKSALEKGEAIGNAMLVCKELGNTPANICTPTYLAEQAQAFAKGQKKVKATILDEEKMTKIGMRTVLAVGQGSTEPSQFIQLEYQGTHKKTAPYVLVGKGVCFDTGGINLKPATGMRDMKYDMLGGATVFAAFQAVVALGLPINVVMLIPAVENMPDGHALKQSDVVTTLSGKTVEVMNTDAEGRLILCDALTYAEQFQPKAVIDVATLTGAVIVCLGHHLTGLFANNNKLSKQLLQAGEQSADRCWQLPMEPAYTELLETEYADLCNIGPRGEAASTTAACFLSAFAEKYPWAHLDIAGTASVGAKATGRGIALLVHYLCNQAAS